ncbi:MAG: GHKL domain-containing protein [Eubacteriales bacterium]|nr:GHKL domain-containing protein [Eubacteriales bacterium]
MSADTIRELIFYSLVDYIAYVPLVFFPFRKRLRHSRILSYSSLVVISMGFLIMGVGLVNGFPAWLVPVVSVIAAVGLMYWGLDVQPGKYMTVLLMEYSNASFVAVMAKSLEMFFFPERIGTLYGWTHSVFILIGVVLLYLFDYFVTWKILEPIVNSGTESRAWKYIWITPLSFFIVWFIYTYSSDSYLHGVPENPIILTMLIFFEVGSMVTYFILLQLLYYESEKARLEYQEVLNQSQYKNLSKRIDEARKSRHDIRHHFLVLDTFAKEGNLDGIREYLNQFSEKQASEKVLVYCEHFATNALLSYYSEQAEEEDMEFSAKCNIPSEIGISNKDLTIILSNLLENAMNACRRIEDGHRTIRMLGRYEDAGLTLIIKNTSLMAPKQDKNGRYISTSHSGYGVGVESVQAIVKKYNGVMKMDFDGEIVSVSIMLMV